AVSWCLNSYEASVRRYSMVSPSELSTEESMNIILIGAQGSGKGTQADKLEQALGVCHVASGDLFRKALGEQTPLGLRAKTYMDKGELVPDDITVAMIL